MTVAELRKVLFGPAQSLSIVVDYDGEDFDITVPSPAQAAFDGYLVQDCIAVEKYTYRISLKKAYMLEDGYEEVRSDH